MSNSISKIWSTESAINYYYVIITLFHQVFQDKLVAQFLAFQQQLVFLVERGVADGLELQRFGQQQHGVVTVVRPGVLHRLLLEQRLQHELLVLVELGDAGPQHEELDAFHDEVRDVLGHLEIIYDR